MIPFVAALVAGSIAYLIWRMRFTRPWLERIPLLLDLSLAVSAAGAGTAYLSSRHALISLGYGAALGTAWTGLVVLDYAIAWALSFVPPFAGIDEERDLPGLAAAQARKVLARRLVSLGYVLEERADADTIAVRLIGNKVSWPRRLRPKTVRISIAEREGPGVRLRIRMRYTVPTLGLARHLQPLVDEIVGNVVSSGEERDGEPEDSPDAATRLWLPLEAIVVGMFVFAFLILWLWAFR